MTVSNFIRLIALTALWLTSLWNDGLAQLPEAPGNYGVLSRDTTFFDSSFTQANVSMVIYEPAQNGQPAPGPFPVIAFGHGFQVNQSNYQNLYNHLASHGFFVLAVDEQNGLFSVDHQEFAEQMSRGIRYMFRENLRPGSAYSGRVDSACGVFGHSMGGGSSVLANSVLPELTAIAGLAAAEADPSSIAESANIQRPFLVISSRGDSVTPEAITQDPMYSNAQGPKIQVSLLEGGHCNFVDSPNAACDFGATSTGDAGTLSTAEQQQFALKFLTAFFYWSLKDDSTYLDYLCATGDSLVQMPGVEGRSTVSCALTSLPEVRHTLLALAVHYAPTANELRVFGLAEERNTFAPGASQLFLFDTQGRRIALPAPSSVTSGERQHLRVPLPPLLASGVYVLQLRSAERVQTARVVVQR